MKKFNFLFAGLWLALSSMFVISCSSDDDDLEEDGIETPVVEEDKANLLNSYCDGMYFGDFWKEGFADYYFILSTGEIGYLQNSSIVPMNEGEYVLFCDIWSSLSEDADNAVLPEGVYTANMGRKDQTFNLELTLCTTIYDKEGTSAKIKDVLFKDGTITVKHEGDNYNLTASFITESDEKIDFKYVGPMKFSNQSNDEEIPDNHIRQNLNPNFLKVTNQLFSTDKKEYDNYLLRLFTTDRVSENGIYPFGEGLKLQLDLCTPKGKDISGTYVFGEEKNLKAGEMYPGIWFGQQALGSFCMQLFEDGNAKFCTLEKGKLLINKNSDGQYTIKADFTDADGYTINVDWTGVIEDFVTGSSQSTLEQDVEFNPGNCTDVVYFGDYYVNGTYNYNIILQDGYELLAIDLLAENGNSKELPTGTFTVSKSLKKQTVIPGKIESNTANPTCYVKYKEKDGQLMPEQLAPILNGKLEISKEDNIYTISYEFYDDANIIDKSKVPHKVSGSWSGMIPAIQDYTQQQATKSKMCNLSGKLNRY